VARFGMTILRESWQFWALTAFLFLTFLTGGGSRDDIQSLVILRPAAVIFCCVGIMSAPTGFCLR
jgi:hypothetical protein